MLKMKTFKLIYDDEEPDHLVTGRKSASETTWSDSDTMSADENPKTNMDASNSNSDAVSAKSAEENLTSNTDKDLHSTSSNASDVISEEEISDEDLSDDEFECELCYSVFESESQLNLHMETHSEYTPSDDDGFDAAFGMPKENYKKNGEKI
ncbi:uncharacterized protein LOC134267153 [Saccostrea cucullata]|uniref:uncharacterized protein LOC134267153 n=1 Tax=Saccostrea cuccullata TaxID=36930 RepID=UPI002ED10C19